MSKYQPLYPLDAIGPAASPPVSEGAIGLEATLDFGTESDVASVTLTGLSWVTATTKITVSLFGGTADHPEGSEDALIEDITVLACNRVPGVGFDIVAHAPNKTFGTYKVHIIAI